MNYTLFGVQYYRHLFIFIIFIILGDVFYIKNILFQEKNFLLLNISLFFITLIIIIFLTKLYNKINQEKNMFLEFFISNLIYLFYLLFFFLIGILILNLNQIFIFKNKAKQIKEVIKIEENIAFRIHDIIKFDQKSRYMCFLIKAVEKNPYFESGGNLRLCSNFFTIHKNQSYKIDFSNTIVNLYDFKIKPINNKLYEYDYDLRLNYFTKNIIGVIYSNNINFSKLNHNNFEFFSYINNTRYNLSLKFLEIFGENNGSIIAALICGNRAFISKNLNDNLKFSSMLHLIAISGLHISFISFIFYKIIFFLLRFFIYNFSQIKAYFLLKKISLIISAGFVFFYVIFSGLSVSSQRAFLMFFISISQIIFLRQQSQLKSIIYTILILLIINPLEILNPGLQMSFLSIIGINIFSDKSYQAYILKILNKIPISNILNSFFYKLLKSFSISLGPHIITLPVTVFYFNQLTTYSFISNIIAIPIMTMIIAPSILLYMLSDIMNLKFLEKILYKIINFGLNLLNQIADFFTNNTKYNLFQIDQISNRSFFFMIFGFLILFIFKKKMRIYLFFICFSLSFIFMKIDNTVPDYLIIDENRSINYLLFDKRENIIYYYIKNNGFKKSNLNYFIFQKFKNKYFFIELNRQDMLEVSKKFNNIEILESLEPKLIDF